jgi:pectinesterase
MIVGMSSYQQYGSYGNEKASSPGQVLSGLGVVALIFIVALVGEDKANTQIVYTQARDIWRCENPTDWGTATVNINGSDIILEKLTITNDFGFELKNDLHIDCPKDSLNPFKTVKRNSHQMALRTFNTTRLIARDCAFKD